MDLAQFSLRHPDFIKRLQVKAKFRNPAKKILPKKWA